MSACLNRSSRNIDASSNLTLIVRLISFSLGSMANDDVDEWWRGFSTGGGNRNGGVMCNAGCDGAIGGFSEQIIARAFEFRLFCHRLKNICKFNRL